MKRFPSLFFICILILAACQDSPEKQSKKTELRNRITSYEDSLATLQKDPKKAAQITSLAQIELINRLKAYSQAFPKDTFSADCLFKTHMIYEQLGAPLEARAYADTLLERFPNYKNRSLLLESLASSYDMNMPRDTTKVRYYFNLLLQEPTTTKEQKMDIKKRLAQLALTFEQYIMQKN
jgi:outer membrane protein assembly factor BamD (BamD/ComL family)